MTETLTKIVVDCSTGEQTIVPLTAEEIAQREADAQAYAEQKAIQEAEEAAKATAKASAIAKLAALGLSDTEIAAITA
jgi:DNA-binding NarL/FixJ family response regulator